MNEIMTKLKVSLKQLSENLLFCYKELTMTNQIYTEEEVEEVSLSTTLITKFLSNIGLNLKDIVIKIIPCEFGIENANLENIPTLMLRMNSLNFGKNPSSSEKLQESVNIEDTSSSVADSTLTERPIPHILMILKSKFLKIGQISVHMLSSPFGSEIYNNPKWENLEFPYTFPPINHISTLLCLGNPDIPSACAFELSMKQDEENERLFHISSNVS